MCKISLQLSLPTENKTECVPIMIIIIVVIIIDAFFRMKKKKFLKIDIEIQKYLVAVYSLVFIVQK